MIKFSTTEDSWIVATSEGLMIFGKKNLLNGLFSPYELDENITTQEVKKCYLDKNYSKALAIALIINDPEIVRQVYRGIPSDLAVSVAKSVPLRHLD